MSEPLTPLVQLLQVAAVGCGLWLVFLLALTTVARVPGGVGSAARGAARRLAPVALHGLLGLAVGVLAPPAAAQAEQRPTPPAVSLDWPGTSATPAPTTAPSPRQVVGPPAPGGAATPSAATGRPLADVVVRPGDSLWALAARDLGEGAPLRQVAQAWPQWWATNRAVIGDDPDLIRPGTVLHRPDRTQESS